VVSRTVTFDVLGEREKIKGKSGKVKRGLLEINASIARNPFSHLESKDAVKNQISNNR
jgi:hypothetical protein